MKKGFLLLFSLLLMLSLCSYADEEVSLFAAPAPTAVPAVVQGHVAAPEASPEPTQVPMLAADGGTIITISALGDLTFGGDVRKSVNIFERELTKQKGDLGIAELKRILALAEEASASPAVDPSELSGVGDTIGQQ